MKDTIYRQDAIDAVHKAGITEYDETLAIEEIERVPLAQTECKAEIRKGYWVKHNTGHSVYYDCSRCGCAAPCTETADKFLWKLSNYCPDCGSEMRNAGGWENG